MRLTYKRSEDVISVSNGRDDVRYSVEGFVQTNSDTHTTTATWRFGTFAIDREATGMRASMAASGKVDVVRHWDGYYVTTPDGARFWAYSLKEVAARCRQYAERAARAHYAAATFVAPISAERMVALAAQGGI